MRIMFIGTGVSSVLGFRRVLMEKLLSDGHQVDSQRAHHVKELQALQVSRAS